MSDLRGGLTCYLYRQRSFRNTGIISSEAAFCSGKENWKVEEMFLHGRVCIC